MEKIDHSLLKYPYQEFIWGIVNEVRRAARVVPEFKNDKNGCIRITMVPLSSLAENWLGGGLSVFPTHLSGQPRDICERDFTYKIDPEGSHTMQYTCEDGHIEPVNCYGFSALKVAYVSWKRQFDDWVKKNDIPETLEEHEFHKRVQYLVPENGYTDDKGSICTTVTLDDTDFMRIYVTVSGAQLGATDEQCALSGVVSIQHFSETVSEKEPIQLKLHPDYISVQDT